MVQFLCPFSCCGILVEYLVSFLWGGSEKASKQCREKRGLSVAIESDLSATEKDVKKDKIRKNAITKRKKASNQAENDHSQRFQENTSTISKNPISTNQATIKQIHGLIIPHFHICNLLRSLYQLTKYNTIPPQSISSPTMIPVHCHVSQQMKWNSSRSTFQYELVLLPDSVRKCYGCSQRFNDCTGIVPKISLSVIEINVLWGKTYLVILRTVLISILRITTSGHISKLVIRDMKI